MEIEKLIYTFTKTSLGWTGFHLLQK